MKDFDGIMHELDLIMRQQLLSEQQLRELGRFGFGAGEMEDELQADLRQSIARNRARLLRLLQRTVEFPRTTCVISRCSKGSGATEATTNQFS